MLACRPFGSIGRLSIVAGAAVAALLACSVGAHARFGGFHGGASISHVGHGPSGSGRFQKFHTTPERHGRWRSDGPSTVGKDPERHRPHHKRPPRPHRIVPLIGGGTAVGTIDPAGAGPSQPPSNLSGPPARRAAIDVPPAGEQRFVEDEVVLEFAGDMAPRSIARLLARHRLTQIESTRLTLSNSIFVRARVPDLRSVRAALGRLGGETILRSGQPNYVYQGAQSAGTAAANFDSAQYAIRKLHLEEAHTLANGDRVLVAVIDSGIDLSHPELHGVVAGAYDALGVKEPPQAHGTGVAGAIAAHAKLVGAAPSARILAIRAFGAQGTGVAATSFAVLKGIDYAATHRARVVNMSFAGPADPALSRALAAAHRNGLVLIAASGNFGPKAAPQFPAADPNVIAVSATDPNDAMFKAASVGPHIAVTAPGVDLLLPSPGGAYQLASGTSFAAAYVSGVAALILQREPSLSPDGVRRILEATATDLGPRGRDDLYGAGLVDAYGAIVAVQSKAAAAGPDDLPHATERLQ